MSFENTVLVAVIAALSLIICFLQLILAHSPRWYLFLPIPIACLVSIFVFYQISNVPDVDSADAAMGMLVGLALFVISSLITVFVKIKRHREGR